MRAVVVTGVMEARHRATVAAHLAGGLIQAGHGDVVLVDLDPAGSTWAQVFASRPPELGFATFLEGAATEPFWHTLVLDVVLGDVVVTGHRGKLHLLAPGRGLEDASRRAAGSIPERLRTVLAQAPGRAKVAVVAAPALPHALARCALNAGVAVLVPIP